MTDEPRKTKDRSPNFPFISLENAIQRAQQFYIAEKRSAAPFQVAAGHWGYSASSSGAFQTAGALKSYGLMTDEESGAKRSLRLSDLALRILLDQRPDPAEKIGFMRQAALSPTVAAEIYARWPDELPSKPTLHHFLVLDRGFGDEKANSVVKILYANEQLTKSAKASVASPTVETDNEGSEDERIGGVMENVAAASTSAPVSPQRNLALNQERLRFAGAEVVINFSGEPTYETFDFIEQYMVLRKKLLPKPESK